MKAATMPAHNITVDPKTLSNFIMEQRDDDTNNNACNTDLAVIINAIAVASKVIANAVTVSDIQSLHGLHGDANASGEDQKTLDVLSNEVMINVLQRTNKVGIMVSEENPGVVTVEAKGSGKGDKYAVVFDPLDGSSNIECNVSVGTIFGIYKVADPSSPSIDDTLQQGKNLICAGYVLYSSSTVMVLSLGLTDGVRSFTIDPTFGEFVETASSPFAIPANPKRIISVNAGNSEIWNLPTSEFVRWTKRQKERYSLRYIGSMVADVHRTLLYGGIFMYPADFYNRSGKLRLLYECFPMAFLVEAAGGMASTGTQRILDVQPTEIHQRCPIYLGCTRDVLKVEELFRTVPSLYSMHDAPQVHTSKRKSSLTSSEHPHPHPHHDSQHQKQKQKHQAQAQCTGTGLLSMFRVAKCTLTDSYTSESTFELGGTPGKLFQDTVQMSDAKWTLATECDTGKRGLLPTNLLALVATDASPHLFKDAAQAVVLASFPSFDTTATAATDEHCVAHNMAREALPAIGGGLMSSRSRELCEIELTQYVLSHTHHGDAEFELSASKGALLQNVQRMADKRWSMATDSGTGQRGLVPTHLLSPTISIVDHKIAKQAFAAHSEFEVDFAQGDAATKFRLMNDVRWCYAENTRTKETGVLPASIFI